MPGNVFFRQKYPENVVEKPYMGKMWGNFKIKNCQPFENQTIGKIVCESAGITKNEMVTFQEISNIAISLYICIDL